MILTYLCYTPGSLTAPVVAGLLEADIGFEPEVLRSDRLGRSGGVIVTPEVLLRLRSLDRIGWLSATAGEQSFRLTGLGRWPGQVIALRTEGWPSASLIREASRLRGFNAGMSGDADDVFWQSLDDISVYEARGREWNHLPTIWDDVLGRHLIDVSQNAGRRVGIPGMWLWPSAKIWFGPGALKVIGRERVLSLPVGRVHELTEGLVEVVLFDQNAPTSVIRESQQALRDWLDYDRLEAMAPSLAEELDPSTEVEVGVFGHGGVRRVIEWRSDGELVRRSEADQCCIAEFDEDGSVVWEEVQDLA